MPTTTKPTTRTQTVRIAGVRTKLTTRNGKVTATKAAPLEWQLQAAQVRAMRAMPEHGKQFVFAGDQNAARRGPKARMQAIATGLAPGEPDVRIYAIGGRLLLIENKVGNGALSPVQVQRHAALARLGYRVEVVRATSEDDAAAQAVALVREWLSANSEETANQPVDKSAAQT